MRSPNESSNPSPTTYLPEEMTHSMYTMSQAYRRGRKEAEKPPSISGYCFEIMNFSRLAKLRHRRRRRSGLYTPKHYKYLVGTLVSYT